MNGERLRMDKKEVTSAVKAVYRKGYSEGFTDACTLMNESTMALVESMNESLDAATQIFEELKGLK